MKPLLGVALLVFWIAPVAAQVTGNALTKTVQIRVGQGGGTAFIVDRGDRQYAVTANHVVKELGDEGRIEIYDDRAWRLFNVQIVHGTRACADVAIMAFSEKKIAEGDPLPYSEANTFFISQEAYFLGFPYGLRMEAPKQHLTVPLVKHAYISAVIECSALYSGASANDRLILLDGFNNPGFSGGPVVVHDLANPKRPLVVIGVISGFRAEESKVKVRGNEAPGVSVETNTGIIEVIPFERARELMEVAEKRLSKQSAWFHRCPVRRPEAAKRREIGSQKSPDRPFKTKLPRTPVALTPKGLPDSCIPQGDTEDPKPAVPCRC